MSVAAVAELAPSFFGRPVCEVAEELIGCTLEYGGTAGIIVETEAYHESEPACHAYIGMTERNAVLFGPAAHTYVYLSYGVHSLLNFVTGPPGEGAAVLIRALRPSSGIEAMRARRGAEREADLCSGPGKLTQALGIGLEHNGNPLGHGGVRVLEREVAVKVATGPRVGINKATELRWRYGLAESPFLSRPKMAAD